RGRTVAWTTDIGPHWLSQDFLGWPLYGRLMGNMVRWLAGTE
ncbi:glutamine amidotransferase, partial [Mesorhizobium salmacidum]